jgi:hypothetical protein
MAAIGDCPVYGFIDRILIILKFNDPPLEDPPPEDPPPDDPPPNHPPPNYPPPNDPSLDDTPHNTISHRWQPQ